MKNKTEFGLLPPQEIESEKYILGSLLIQSNIMMKLIDEGLTRKWFYKEQYGNIFEAAIVLFNNNKPIDFITILNTIKSLKYEINPLEITNLSKNIGSVNHLEIHIELIKNAFIKRESIRHSSEITELCYENENLNDIITVSNKNNEQINELHGGKEKAKNLKELLENSLTEAEKRASYYLEHHTVKGIKSNLSNLDNMTYGFQENKLIILGGRPGMGKTAFAVKIAKETSKENNVLFFSLEMDEKELTDRLILSNTEINPDKYAKGDLKTSDWSELENSASKLQLNNIHIEDTATMTIEKIKAKSMMYKQKNKCDIIIIDYLQLIDMRADNKNYNRVTEVGQVSRKLKLLSKELKIPIIVLSQLSRKVEERTNKRPILSDLRESGDIEQDADIVIFCYRPSYYEEMQTNDFELVIAKNRAGMTGIVKLYTKTGLTDFYEKAPENMEIPDEYNFNNKDANAFIEPNTPF